MKITFNITLLLLLFSLYSGLVLSADNFQLTTQGAQYKDLKSGEGEVAQLGDIATIHFTGWLDSNGTKGKEIYNTRREQKTVSFVIGSEKVMQGWNEGVLGMKPGGKRLLKLPPTLAYGAKGVQQVIPPNARLIFVIDLIQLEKQLLH